MSLFRCARIMKLVRKFFWGTDHLNLIVLCHRSGRQLVGARVWFYVVPTSLKNIRRSLFTVDCAVCSVDNSNDESGQCFVPQQRGALQPPQIKNNSMSLVIEAQAAYLLTTKSCYSSILKPFWNMTQAFFFSENSLSLVQNNFQQYCVKLWKIWICTTQKCQTTK